MEESKETFINLYEGAIKKDGADKLLKWLEKSDFFTAPASTRFHLSEPGGLCKHSIHVALRLEDLCEDECRRNPDFIMPDTETIYTVGLLHDVCKANFYKVEMRNRKNEQGKWEQYPFYVVEDALPFGHGEKSVYIISGFMKLTREEAMAIRWHMGGWNQGEAQTAGNAFNKYPLAVLTHIADLQATYLDEVPTGDA